MRNLPPAKRCSNSLLRSMPWLVPLVLLPLNPKLRKSQFRKSAQRPDPIKPGMIPGESLSRILSNNSPEGKLLSPRTPRLLQNHRLLLTPLTLARRLISLISSNSTGGHCLSPNRLSSLLVLPRRSLNRSNRLRLVRIPAGTTTLQWTSIPQRGSERRKVPPSLAVVIGRVKKAVVGANKRALSMFSFPPSSFLKADL